MVFGCGYTWRKWALGKRVSVSFVVFEEAIHSRQAILSREICREMNIYNISTWPITVTTLVSLNSEGMEPRCCWTSSGWGLNGEGRGSRSRPHWSGARGGTASSCPVIHKDVACCTWYCSCHLTGRLCNVTFQSTYCYFPFIIRVIFLTWRNYIKFWVKTCKYNIEIIKCSCSFTEILAFVIRGILH